MKTFSDLLHFLHINTAATFKPTPDGNFNVHPDESHAAPVAARVTPDVIQTLHRDGLIEQSNLGWRVKHSRAVEAHRYATENSHHSDFTTMAAAAGLGAMAGYGLHSLLDDDSSSSSPSYTLGVDTPSDDTSSSFSGGGGDFSGGGSSDSFSSSDSSSSSSSYDSSSSSYDSSSSSYDSSSSSSDSSSGGGDF